MESNTTTQNRLGSILLFLISISLCLAWVVVRAGAFELSLLTNTALSGLAIFGAAYVLSWAAELAQFDIPQALAMIFVALIAVLPEYAVDMYYAWAAGKDPSYIQYAAANMTGSNRLLIGLGWVLVLGVFWIRSRKPFFLISVKHRLEMLSLLGATAYAFFIAAKGTLTLFDTAVLLLIFIGYVRGALRQGVDEPVVEDGITDVIARWGAWPRRAVSVGMFVIAGSAIGFAAQPFAEGLLSAGTTFGIDRFLLVQWVAPLASESPEFIVAAMFAWRFKPEVGLGTLISSKVNQWTLLIGMLPLAYAISSGSVTAMMLDGRQVEEVLLTAAQSLFALLVIMDLKFSWKGAALLCVLFLTQLAIPDTTVRYIYAITYLGLSGAMISKSRLLRNGLRQTLRMVYKHSSRA